MTCILGQTRLLSQHSPEVGATDDRADAVQVGTQSNGGDQREEETQRCQTGADEAVPPRATERGQLLKKLVKTDKTAFITYLSAVL